MSLTGIAFLLLYTGGLGAALIRGPKWGLWTYMMVFYLHPPSRLGAHTAVAESPWGNLRGDGEDPEVAPFRNLAHHLSYAFKE